MLIIPSIRIKNGACVHAIAGEPGTENFYGVDPVRRAVLWRSENAKSLHVVDIDRAETGDKKNVDIIKKMTSSIVITVQLAGGLKTYQDVDDALNRLNVFRVIIDSIAIEDQVLASRLIKDFSSRKIIVEMNAKNGFVYIDESSPANISVIDFVLKMKEIGVERIIYKNVDHELHHPGPPLDELNRIAEASTMNITLNGCIRNYSDLKLVQDLHHPKFDSIILTKALNENAFPCQKIWRIYEKMQMENDRN